MDDKFGTGVAGSLLEGLGSFTFLSIAGNRMFFNLKEAAEHGVNLGTNWSSYSHSAIQFDEPGPQNGEGQCVCFLFLSPPEISDAHRSDVGIPQFVETRNGQGQYEKCPLRTTFLHADAFWRPTGTDTQLDEFGHRGSNHNKTTGMGVA